MLAGEAEAPKCAKADLKRTASGHRSAPPRRTASAISKTGHTRAGRVKQKSHKSAELVSAGQLRHVQTFISLQLTMLQPSLKFSKKCMPDWNQPRNLLLAITLSPSLASLSTRSGSSSQETKGLA